jgi:2-polyprenyl-6-methoxyphenol hydroxylase-like FAD-dependent oxidoreductase
VLIQRGIDVVVLERRSTPASRPRAFGIHPPGMAALDAAGVGAAVRAVAAVIRSGVASSGGRRLADFSFAARPILSLPQDEIERMLEARLTELDPGALQRDAEVIALRERGDAVELSVRAAPAADASCVARFVVGVDGIRSTVRAQLGAEWILRRGSGEYAMADTRATREPSEVAVLRLEPGGVVESFPLSDGGRRWVVRLRHPVAHLDPAAFATLVHDRTAIELDPETMSPPSLFAARQHVARPFARGRIALAGDAAHEISPIGGQGMNLGWLDAMHLAGTLAEALETRTGGAPFGRYDAVRRSAAERAVRRARFNMAMGAARSGPGLLGRDALIRSLAIPGVRGAFADAFTMRGL